MSEGEARTVAEAYLYLELTLPPGEGGVDYRRHTTLHPLDDGRLLLRFDGPYEGVHHTLEVPVAAAGEDDAEPYGAGRSRLIDAGQWYVIESAYAGLAEAAVDELAGAPADEPTYWGVIQAWECAAAAAGEIEKFLPAQGEEVPAAAFWTEHGRRVRDRRRDAFRRARPAESRRYYLRRLDAFRASRPAPAPDLPAQREPVEQAPVPAPLPVRTYGEAHVYMDVHPCDCGSAQFPRGQLEVLDSDERAVVIRYAGPCDECGRPRGFTFRMPQRPGLPPGSPYGFSYPQDGPSVLLDAGDWAAVGAGYAAVSDFLPEADDAGQVPDASAAEDTVKVLTCAAAAVDEVLKFLPEGRDSLPDSAFFTATGAEFRRIVPAEQFHRPFLERQRAERWGRVAAFAARYGR